MGSLAARQMGDARIIAKLMPCALAVLQFIVPWYCETSIPVRRAIRMRDSSGSESG